MTVFLGESRREKDTGMVSKDATSWGLPGQNVHQQFVKLPGFCCMLTLSVFLERMQRTCIFRILDLFTLSSES